MGKLLFLDVESTGTDPEKHGLVQIAGIIEIDGVIKEEFDLKCRPFAQDEITQEALDVTKLTQETIMSYPDPVATYKNFVNILGKHVNKYKKNKTLNDKFYLIGQNISFDNDMIDTWFKKCGDNYWYAYRHFGMVDLVCITTLFEIGGIYKGENKKLGTVAKEFGLEYSAHDALCDIQVTREIFYRYINIIKPFESST